MNLRARSVNFCSRSVKFHSRSINFHTRNIVFQARTVELYRFPVEFEVANHELPDPIRPIHPSRTCVSDASTNIPRDIENEPRVYPKCKSLTGVGHASNRRLRESPRLCLLPML
jgi:hypothetical protein